MLRRLSCPTALAGVAAAVLLSPSLALAQVQGGGSDTTAPSLVSMSISPASVNSDAASDADRTFTVTMRVSDDVSGWDGLPCAAFRSPTLPAGGNHTAVIQCSSGETSGTALDLTRTMSLVIPRYAYPGTWTLSNLCLVDKATNRRCYSTAAQIDAAGGQSSIRLIDDTPPSISCASADTAWHALNVSLDCTAGDTSAGLANASDASFSLSTTVADGTETADASTGTRQVCDRADPVNCATAGPLSGNKIDRKAPSITITTPAEGSLVAPGAVMNADYGCTDGGSGIFSCAGDVAAGSPVDTSAGNHSFTVTATDAVGNTSTRTVNYTAGTDTDGDTVLDGEDNCPDLANEDQEDADGDDEGDACDETPFPDTTAPVVTAAADKTAEATGADGAVVTFDAATASDDFDGSIAAPCVPASGSKFALGKTTVTCTATDAAGNSGSDSLVITVVDTTAPALTHSANITSDPSSAAGTLVTYDAPKATDLVDGAVAATCAPASGSRFPAGATTTVSCSTTDAAGNQRSGGFTVTVRKWVEAAKPPVTLTCSSKRVVTIHIAKRYRGRLITSAKGVVVGRKIRAQRTRRGYTITVDMRGAGRITLPVRVTLNLRGGKRVQIDRTFHPCRPGPSAGPTSAT